MPQFTAAQIAKAARDPVADPHIALIELSEDHVSGTLRFARNNEDVVHNGNTYTKGAFELTLPGAGTEEPKARLSASNLLRTPGRALLLSRFTIRARLIVIDHAAPNTALIDTSTLLKAGAWGIDGESVSIDLKPAVSYQEPYPFARTSESQFPAAWLTR